MRNSSSGLASRLLRPPKNTMICGKTKAMLGDSGTILDYDNHAGTSAQYFLPLHDAHFDISSVDVVETSTY